MPAIEAENISKIYRLGVKLKRDENIVSSIGRMLKSPISNYKKYRSLYKFEDVDQSKREDTEDILWALKNVSFKLDHGEVVGLIGHNGAGKSTLLKVISRITPPSHGHINMRGRVASLLEVGTGFHPELTGRENVYLNGTVLGMSRREIDSKFDEIVAFSEVEDFLDTPVKRYSSGMRVRLAFSVAAHLEPEILIVDEVLAVGDASFQNKCLSKMEDVGGAGRTVMFVSHNMAAVTRLCKRGLLIGHGQLLMDGSMHKVVDAYLHDGHGTSSSKEWDGDGPQGEYAELKSVRVIDQKGEVSDVFDIRETVSLEVTFNVSKTGRQLLPHFHVFNQEGIHLFPLLAPAEYRGDSFHSTGEHIYVAKIPGNYLAEGMHYVTCSLMTMSPDRAQFVADQVIGFQVVDSDELDTVRAGWGGKLRGAVRPMFAWEKLS
ncbi:MAG: ABC transporter ATP-binding protein [Pseudomonadota bacterium]